MDHAQAQSTFSDFVEGSLPERERVEVEQHLAACIQCRTELQSFRRTVGSLGKLKLSALTRPLLRAALEALRPHPLRVDLARDHHRDAGLLPRDAAQHAQRRPSRAVAAKRRSRTIL